MVPVSTSKIIIVKVELNESQDRHTDTREELQERDEEHI